MSDELIVDFHDKVYLEVHTKSELVCSFYQKEYKNHITDKFDGENPFISLNIKLTGLPGKEEGLVSASHKVLARWNYAIELTDNRIQIDANSNYFGFLMIHHMIVHPGIRYLLANRNILMLHAGAVSISGKSIIITGKGGAGKTTLTSQLLADHDEIHPHADDYIFLDQNKRSLAYITRSHFYQDLLQRVPILQHRLSLSERIGIFLFSSIRDMSSGKIKWPTRIPQERLWPDRDYELKAKPQAIIFLKREETDLPKLIRSEDVAGYAQELLTMNFNEARYFIDLISRQSEPQSTQWLSRWQEKEHQLIVDLLEELPYYYLILPDEIENPLHIRKAVNDLIFPLLA